MDEEEEKEDEEAEEGERRKTRGGEGKKKKRKKTKLVKVEFCKVEPAYNCSRHGDRGEEGVGGWAEVAVYK